MKVAPRRSWGEKGTMSIPSVFEAHILIIDDEPGNIRILERLLKGAGFLNLHHVQDPEKSVETYQALNPDLILLDLKMPGMDGFAVMEALKAVEQGPFLPILVLTAQRDVPTRVRALKSGAKDFLPKPFEMTEALVRVQNMLEISLLHKQNCADNRKLEEKVRERTRELKESQFDVIQRLARAVEIRETETGNHILRMSHLCARLAKEMGLDAGHCELIHHASPLHDIGKIGIPDQILMNSHKLNDEEWEIMRMHPIMGAEILSGSESKLLQMAESICMTHQERWDGSGYPGGLRGEEIPIEARIVAVCDVFDALVSKRHYKDAFPVDLAVEILQNNSGTDFDPAVVQAFMAVLPEMVEIIEQFPEVDHSSILRHVRPSLI